MKRKNLTALLLAAALTFSLAGCGSQKNQPEAGGFEDRSMIPVGETVRPAPGSLSLREENSYPYLGMSFTASPGLRTMIDAGMVFVDVDGEFQVIQNADGTYAENVPLNYGYIHFAATGQEQRGKMPRTDSPDAITDYEEFTQWLDEGTAPAGRLSVFHTSYLEGKELSELTGMENNTEIGQAGDYRFYFSTSTGEGRPADAVSMAQSLAPELQALVDSLTVQEPLPMDENYCGFATTQQAALDGIGDFQAADLDGNTVTSDALADYDLTMVNVWTTWCDPCVAELPDLAELAEEMKDQGVQILGVVADVVDPATGEANEETLELARTIRDKTGVKYPILLPDDVLLNGILSGIPGYPKTFFFDKNGSLIDETMGSRSKDQWAEMIAGKLEQVKG